ncbi:MAG: TfuA domain-containing protein [Candidatus Thiodiazotropha endolucinida]
MRSTLSHRVIFAGPSLGSLRPSSFLHLRGPARRGDLAASLSDNLGSIVLADGFWGNVPAVSHHEILELLDRGIRVYGCSSMGALRAAELHSHGMKGVGSIYERFRSGELSGDDEVAILHAPAELSYTPLTFPLVELRDTVHALQEQGLLSKDAADLIVEISTSKPLRDRTLESVMNDCFDQNDLAQNVGKLISYNWKSTKTLDLALCLSVEASYAANRTRGWKRKERTSWAEEILVNNHPFSRGVARDLLDIARLYYPSVRFIIPPINRVFWAEQVESPMLSVTDEIEAWWEGLYSKLSPSPSQELARRGVPRADAVWVLRALRTPVYSPNSWNFARSDSGGLPLWYLACALKLSEACLKLEAAVDLVIGNPVVAVDLDLAQEAWAKRRGVTASRAGDLAAECGFTTTAEWYRALQLTHPFRDDLVSILTTEG